MPVSFRSYIVPSILATVSTDEISYGPGETINVTVNHGLHGLDEWVTILVSTDDDYGPFVVDSLDEIIWKYVTNNSKTQPVSPPGSYPITVTLNVPAVPGTYSIRYFATNNRSQRLAISANFDITQPPAFVPDYYASPTGAGTHSGLTIGNAMQISEFWAVATAGDNLGLLDGTYTGANSMIQPPLSAGGSAGNPITIRAINDGAVTIDGTDTLEPVRLRENNYITLIGFDACNSSATVVQIGGNTTDACSNIICQRIVAYDAAAVANEHIWTVWNSADVLVEDCAAFGRGRYTFHYFSSRDPNNLTIRRFWSRWMQQTDLPSSGGPKGVNLSYDAENVIAENFFATWDETENGSSPEQDYGPLWGAGNNPPVLNTKLYGCVSYIRAVDVSDSGVMEGLINIFNSILGATVEHCIGYVEPASHTEIKGFNLLNYNGGGDSNKFVTRCTSINNQANVVENQWQQSGNLFNQTAVPTGTDNVWDGTSSNGARIYYRYVDGVLTTDPLWPWPMDSRIAAAVTASGRSVTTFFGSGNSGLTDLMEDIFGAIP